MPIIQNEKKLDKSMQKKSMNNANKPNQLMLVERLRPLNTAKRQALFTLLATKGLDPASLPIVAMPKETVPVTSYAQQRQWILWQLDPDNSAYNMPVVLKLTGTVNIDALQRSFNQLVSRHETLRTTFVMKDGLPKQCIHDSIGITIKEFKLVSRPRTN